MINSNFKPLRKRILVVDDELKHDSAEGRAARLLAYGRIGRYRKLDDLVYVLDGELCMREPPPQRLHQQSGHSVWLLTQGWGDEPHLFQGEHHGMCAHFASHRNGDVQRIPP